MVKNSISDTSFICDCEQWHRSACLGEPFYKEHENKRYCVLHHPPAGKEVAFDEAFKRKLLNNDLDFRGVVFPSPLKFIQQKFSGLNVSGAVFLSDVLFEFCTLEKARFW